MTLSATDSPIAQDQITSVVEQVLRETQFIDIHTHLFSPAFRTLGLWGIDELLTYHYLEAEFFRSSLMTPEQYWELTKVQRADTIWRTLFVENTPISEATRGVIAVLNAFGLSTTESDLKQARTLFEDLDFEAHLSRTLQIAAIDTVVMTNDPLDPVEREFWLSGVAPDPRFRAAMRLDRLLNEWADNWRRLSADGYAVDAEISPRSITEIRRFLSDWSKRMSPAYMAVSLPDTFQFPEQSTRSRILSGAVLPACRELGLPLSLMIGVRRQVNPRIRLAGDGVGRADLRSLENLCRDFPENRFLVSVLSRENQHELCVYARKFSNLLPFGCWWFLNNSSIVEEITRERLEMLGTSFIPQHSDARVLEQVIYKWKNTRTVLAKVLAERYRLLVSDGRMIIREDIQRDINRMFRANFENWMGPT